MCPQNEQVPVVHGPPAAAFVPRATEATVVTGVDGKPYALNQPLVPPGHYPRGRWDAEIVVKGIPRTIIKPTAIETFNEAMRLMQLNAEPFWFVNLWLNLNLQWIPRVPVKYQIVTVEQLEQISHPVTP